MISDFPKSLPKDYHAEEDMTYMIDAVTGIRTIRGELNIPPSLKLNVAIKTLAAAAENILTENIQYLKWLSRASEIEIGMNVQKPSHSATSVKSSMEIYIPLKGVLNIAAELDRLNKDEEKIEESLSVLNKKLFNEDFIKKAPREIVEKEKAKYEELINIKERIAKSKKMFKDAEGKNGS
jgi:valyl-tRNA synthetase